MPTVYVAGLEPFNLALLEAVPQADEMHFRELLNPHESVEVEPGFSFNETLELAERRLRDGERADAILNYWDFPGACLAPVLCQRQGLPAPRLETVAMLEHKYWARREMNACVPDVTPNVCAVDPFAENPSESIDLDFPFWLKPVVSHSSYLGFRIDDADELQTAIAAMRQHIGTFGNPFDEFLDIVGRPAAVAEVGGCFCIAEEIISADAQVTLEGYVFNGDVTVYGHVDSLREGQSRSSFSRYEYPSRLPRQVLERMENVIARVLNHVGYDNAPFNAEFFWDEPSDRISLLEVNTRISKSHCPLFQDVDGASHQKVILDLALGREPVFPQRKGRWPKAAKFMVRLFQDGEIIRIPSAPEIHHMQSRYPEALIQILVKEGQRLSHLAFQDSYSFEIADIFVGGRSDKELMAKHADIMELLPFEIGLTAPQSDEVR
ncbi:ATP-grasp domain-containing protein [Chelativorans salis]|uniref:ATP-grasp domain-containing protein n=1 Tax=Chelativorans salis TaxID=2978478 RepID=A0ABT2LHZ0_9HYPH|nr:ATP-grasp domain-containing protein [Chelativorans sp. EGI FJ00035]MCT7374185.1 ATP-grasp domain-containing protein [Chelativorans sp. EGI FJ00035]